MRAHPMAGDSVLAVLLGLFDLMLFAADGFAEVPELPPWYVGIPVIIAMVTPLVFRRKSPLWSAYVVLVISIVHAALMLGIGSAAGLAMSIYSVVVYAGRRQGVVFVGAVVVASAVQLLIEQSGDILIAVLFLAFGIALCWTLGEFVGARRAYDVEVEARLHLLETERDQATRIAVAEERGRIARELHDVVAHAVSVMVVQADGASYAIRSNPELAQRALQTISETGRGALGELRALLDVLRNDRAEGEPRVPQPDAHAIADLAERMRAAGVPVTLETDELGDLPAACVARGVPDRAGVADQHAQARRARRDRVRAAAPDRRPGRGPGVRRRRRPPPAADPRGPRHAPAGRPGRQRADRHARTRPRLRRDARSRPGTGWWVAGPRGAAG